MEKKVGRPPIHSAELIQKIYELYDTTDMGYTLVAQQLGMNRNTIRYYIHKRRKENHPSNARTENASKG